MKDYESSTKAGYLDDETARRYKHQHSGALSWARLAMAREISLVKRTIAAQRRASGAPILDVPCGAGIAAPALQAADTPIVALDISRPMIRLAAAEFRFPLFAGFVQADLTELPFVDGSFSGAVALGIMHRLPDELKRRFLQELRRISECFLVVSVSVEDPVQRLKRSIVRGVRPQHRFAPEPIQLESAIELFRSTGWRLQGTHRVAPVLSPEVIFRLEATSATSVGR